MHVYEITHLPVIGVRGARVGGAGQPILQLSTSLLINQAASQSTSQAASEACQLQRDNDVIPGGLRLRRAVISSALWLDF